ncbi:MAG: hypothetical protein QXH07_07670 [Thermoplasmata archaeon]
MFIHELIIYIFIDNFEDYYLKVEHQKFKPKNKLEEIDKIINYESLIFILKYPYHIVIEKKGVSLTYVK